MSNLTQYKLFIGDDKKNTLFGVTFSFNDHNTIAAGMKNSKRNYIITILAILNIKSPLSLNY